MKLQYDFVINQIAGQYVAVPAGAIGSFNGMIKLNETAAFIFEQFREETTVEDVTAKLMEKFGCDEQTAKENVQAIVKQCQDAGVIS